MDHYNSFIFACRTRIPHPALKYLYEKEPTCLMAEGSDKYWTPLHAACCRIGDDYRVDRDNVLWILHEKPSLAAVFDPDDPNTVLNVAIGNIDYEDGEDLEESKIYLQVIEAFPQAASIAGGDTIEGIPLYYAVGRKYVPKLAICTLIDKYPSGVTLRLLRKAWRNRVDFDVWKKLVGTYCENQGLSDR